VGWFSKKPEETIMCDICGEQEVISRVHSASDGAMCKACYVAAGFPASVSSSLMSISLIKEQISSDDGMSIVKRFKASGGVAPQGKMPPRLNPDGSTPICCPKCGSMSLNASKKGFGAGKAAVGALLLGPLGLAAGAIGSGDVTITCLKCGKQWIAGER
jgi:hypothetical protein